VAGLFQNGQFKRIIEYLQIPCTSPDGQRTSLCAQSFALEIRLVKGRNVVCMDVVKQSDPYVTFRFNNPPGFLRSRTVKRSAAPTWNQILLHRLNLAPQVMQLELWDEQAEHSTLSVPPKHSTLSVPPKQHFIGAASVNLKPIILNTKAYLDAGGIDDDLDKYPRLHQDVEMKLQKHNNKIQGIVTIELRILRIPEKFASRAN
jgi:Ca2+-dependent lipid-binding protein